MHSVNASTSRPEVTLVKAATVVPFLQDVSEENDTKTSLATSIKQMLAKLACEIIHL